MRTHRIAAFLASLLALVGILTLAPASPAAAAGACDTAPGWAAGAWYPAGTVVRFNGGFYIAEHDNPGYDPTISTWYWDPFNCGGGGGGGDCPSAPAWAAGAWYPAGSIVRYTDGLLYIAEHDNPGYDPIISTWYWEPYNCDGGNPPSGGFPVSEAQFNQMFPSRNGFYSYQGLIDALGAYPGFANTGSDEIKRREAAAFLANISHETGGLVHIVEQNTANYPTYCDWGRPYGCPAGQAAYYGRGPLQVSWNFNYKSAGDALGIDLLNNPWLVQNDSAIAWKTALWYWNTQTGPGSMTGHDAIVNDRGFGESIRSINGSVECDGKHPDQVQSRVSSFQWFTQILGTSTGGNLYC
ncbi:glycoside hydrolase family 19 protein [Streptomyces sp. NBC_01092]|uniref:glycoside hydrolase family 19 protein n=1 Tax=Streptomyces sp. NBC_01092 TaxID=2903748 RepID=UPI003869BB97|nr:chitinase [Streptomyces sp. NBC_01092]